MSESDEKLATLVSVKSLTTPEFFEEGSFGGSRSVSQSEDWITID